MKNKQNNPKQNRRQPKKDSRAKRVNFDNTRDDKFERDIEQAKGYKDSRSNDVRWYANNPELLRSAASLPYGSIPGTQLGADPGISVPGVYALYWTPSLGGVDNEDAINQAANSIYSYTVHANSRNQSYDAPDEMLLILAGAQVFSAIALGVRAYGIMKNYNQLNPYTPKALIEASGFDFNNIQSNYSKMWFDLNQLIVQTQQIWIPNTMPVIERWFWMNSNVYMDGDSSKSQYYMFVPYTFWKYNETASSSGGMLESVAWYDPFNPANKGTNSWMQYVQMVQGMIQALIDSQDRGIIFGDILKAYGADKLYAMPAINADYTVIPTYDREVLTQIENSNQFMCSYGLPTTTNLTRLSVNQDPNTGRLHQNWFIIAQSSLGHSHIVGSPAHNILNFHQQEVPTPEQNMVATRLMSMGMVFDRAIVQNSTMAGPAVTGTELIVAARGFYNIFTSGKVTLHSILMRDQWNASDWSEDTNVLREIEIWSAFDWCQGLIVSNYGLTPTSPTQGKVLYNEFMYKMLDYDMYTVIDDVSLRKMHTTAVYSEFGVPAIL